jgi:hypothetical protein
MCKIKKSVIVKKVQTLAHLPMPFLLIPNFLNLKSNKKTTLRGVVILIERR